jgi:hypothetical protein
VTSKIIEDLVFAVLICNMQISGIIVIIYNLLFMINYNTVLFFCSRGKLSEGEKSISAIICTEILTMLWKDNNVQDFFKNGLMCVLI